VIEEFLINHIDSFKVTIDRNDDNLLLLLKAPSHLDSIIVDSEYLVCYFVELTEDRNDFQYFLLYYRDPEFLNKLDFLLTNLSSSMIWHMMLTTEGSIVSGG